MDFFAFFSRNDPFGSTLQVPQKKKPPPRPPPPNFKNLQKLAVNIQEKPKKPVSMDLEFIEFKKTHQIIFIQAG